MAVSVFPAASSGGGKQQYTVRITSTQSWTAPAGVISVEVIMAGGGGGGSGAPNSGTSGSGGGGSVDYNVLTVSPGTAYTITIGAGGAATTSTTANNGTASSFGALWTVAGGNASKQANGTVNSGPVGTGPTYAAGVGLGGASSWFVGVSNSPSGYLFNAQPGAFGFGGGGSGGVDLNAGSGYIPSTTNGGGAGSVRANATNGTANTGGGGGSVSISAAVGTFTSGSGGSGVCIIKYWA